MQSTSAMLSRLRFPAHNRSVLRPDEQHIALRWPSSRHCAFFSRYAIPSHCVNGFVACTAARQCRKLALVMYGMRHLRDGIPLTPAAHNDLHQQQSNDSYTNLLMVCVRLRVNSNLLVLACTKLPCFGWFASPYQCARALRCVPCIFRTSMRTFHFRHKQIHSRASDFLCCGFPSLAIGVNSGFSRVPCAAFLISKQHRLNANTLKIYAGTTKHA